MQMNEFMASAAAAATASALPAWLAATWSRTYIRRAEAGPPSALGAKDDSISASSALGAKDDSINVHYIQTMAEGHGFDLRIPKDLSLPPTVGSVADLTLEQLRQLSAIEGFSGVTTAEPAGSDTCILRWHAAFCFPPQLGVDDEPLAVLSMILEGKHETMDVGRATPTLPAGRGKPVVKWYEHAPDGSYEEEWLMLDGYFKQGAHLAAVRPARAGEGACWLGILGNTFAFVRDIDRTTVPQAARSRPIADVLADESIPLAAKQSLLDAEFSFGFFGQGGGVGGVVECSSLPWRRGVALATMIGDGDAAAEWTPIRSSDAGLLAKALAAVTADHESACQALREAEGAGQTGAVELLRARGAV